MLSSSETVKLVASEKIETIFAISSPEDILQDANAEESGKVFDSFGNTLKDSSTEYESESCSLYDCESDGEEEDHSNFTTGKQALKKNHFKMSACR